jgi:Predicted membrane protein (DUF2142)
MVSVQGSFAAGRGAWRIARVLRPVPIFLVLSLLFGLPAVLLTPPLRGADEPAHVLRAYGIAHGQVLPSLADAQGRKGLFLPAALHDDYDFFEAARYRFGSEGFSYRQVMAEYAQRRSARSAAPDYRPPVFVLYAGSEGYAPLVYLPYVIAVFAARLARLDFVPMLLAMRLLGFALATAVAAYAMAIVPRLKWAFLVIAMLPISLYERAIVSADGAALSCTMMVTALCLRAAAGARDRPPERSLWMTLCVLIKPSHTAFVLLEGMTRPLAQLRRRWPAVLLVIGPGFILALAWVVVGSADVAAWRMIEGTGEPAEHFNVGWKLGFLVRNPGHFLHAVAGSLDYAGELWREMLGVLGWRDTRLPEAVYWLLTAMLLATFLERIDLDHATRRRVAALAALAALGYCAAVFLIFYLAWTPIATDRVHGIQGRYFTIALPPAAVAIAALAGHSPRQTVMAAIGVAAALISGGAMLQAVVRSQW